MEQPPASEPRPNDRTVDSYELIAEDYARETAGHVVLASGLTRLAESVPGGHVLEIGSGPGWDADVLEDAGLKVRRTDVTKGFLDVQRERGKPADQLDAIHDDFGGPYDAVVALHVLQHMDADDLDVILAKVAHALGPDGRFLVSIPLGEGEGWETGDSGRSYYRALRTQAQFEALLEQAGLRTEWTDRANEHEETGWLCVLARLIS